MLVNDSTRQPAYVLHLFLITILFFKQPIRNESRSMADVGRDTLLDHHPVVHHNGTDPRRLQHMTSAVVVSTYDAFLLVVILGFMSAVLVSILIALICYCQLRKTPKSADEGEFASYGAVKPYQGSSLAEDLSYNRKLAQSVQMFHFQHQKQQMLDMEKAKELESQLESGKGSDDETNEDRNAFYECPGLANTGEMEVNNPVYSESPMPRANHFQLAPVPRNAVKRDTS